MIGVGAAVGASNTVDDGDTGVVVLGAVTPGVDCTSGVSDGVSTTTWLAATVPFVSGLSAAVGDNDGALDAELADVDDDPWVFGVLWRVVASLAVVSEPPLVAVDADGVLSPDDTWDVDASSVPADVSSAVVPAVPDTGELVSAPPVLVTTPAPASGFG
jgi:hypothetical protein